jgi:hypothetical protein
MKTRSLYGFSPELEPFVGKTPAEQVDILRSWGNTVVFGGYKDPAFVDAVHRAGMRIYAEYGCFVGERWWNDVPDSRPVTDEGTLLEADGWYYGVNPSVPQVRQERLEGLERLLTGYDIDGVWLDFIRWPCHWEVPQPYLPRTSFDAGTRARFAHDTGIDVSGDDAVAAAQEILQHHGEAWTDWRCAQVTSWVAAAKALIQRVRPGVTLGLFGVPWRLSDRDGAIRTIVGQDYRALGGLSPHVRLWAGLDRRGRPRDTRPGRQAGVADRPVGGRAAGPPCPRVRAGARCCPATPGIRRCSSIYDKGSAGGGQARGHARGLLAGLIDKDRSSLLKIWIPRQLLGVSSQ